MRLRPTPKPTPPTRRIAPFRLALSVGILDVGVAALAGRGVRAGESHALAGLAAVLDGILKLVDRGAGLGGGAQVGAAGQGKPGQGRGGQRGARDGARR